MTSLLLNVPEDSSKEINFIYRVTSVSVRAFDFHLVVILVIISAVTC